MTDGDGCLYPKCKTSVKSYIRCFCCIEGDDLEVIWYRMHLEESRTFHAFEYIYILIMIDVKLTPSDFDRLPVCMNG